MRKGAGISTNPLFHWAGKPLTTVAEPPGIGDRNIPANPHNHWAGALLSTVAEGPLDAYEPNLLLLINSVIPKMRTQSIAGSIYKILVKFAHHIL